MACITCGDDRAYGMPKTESERLASHSAIYGTTNLPPRGTGALKTIGCQICGQSIEVPPSAKEFVCPYCNSIYEVTSPTLQNNGWMWPFVGGLILGFIVFAPLGRAMVKTLGEATLTELEAAAARRKAKVTVPGEGMEW